MPDPAMSPDNSKESLTENLFRQLSGSCSLDRRLNSTNTLEPAGNCHGSATLSPREPSVFINNDGKLELASAEMIYHEQGYFEMDQTPDPTNTARFPFARKYVWRLSRNEEGSSFISVWFTKPGTEEIDYLFHKIDLTVHETEEGDLIHATLIDGNAGHLCEEDLYSSAYTFELRPQIEGPAASLGQFAVQSWTMLHEVQGPKKDQVIETRFKRM